MRGKKALKRLGKAASLISTVKSGYTPQDPHLEKLLDSVTAIIEQAKTVLGGRSGQSPRTATNEGSQPEGLKTAATPEFTGNKTDFVRAVVAAGGTLGAAPREINEAFRARQIDRSRNLVYTALGALVRQKKLTKKGDRYFSASMDSTVKSGPTKKRISPQGLTRISEASRKRWAEKNAAEHSRPTSRPQRSGTKKGSHVVRRSVGKKVTAKRAAAKARV